MFQPTTPVVIIARNLEIPDEMMQAAEEKQIVILRSHDQPAVYQEKYPAI